MRNYIAVALMTEAQAEANRARARVHYWKHHDAMLEKMRRFRETHREEKRTYNREYGRRNSDKRREYYLAHREEQLAKGRERRRLWRLTHPKKPRQTREEANERKRLFREANRDRLNAKHREAYHRNRDKELARGKAYRERNSLLLLIKGRCNYYRDHEANLARSRRYYQTHKAEHRANQKARRNDPARRARYLERKRAAYYRRKGKEKRTLEWHIKQVAKQKAKARSYARQQSKQMTTAYVRRLLSRGTNLRPEDFSPEIVRVARAKLRLLRAARNKRKVT